MFLDELLPVESKVGFGNLGLKTDMGFAEQQITCRGKYYPHSIGAHAPSHITYLLNGNYNSFECEVSINDTSPNKKAKVDFAVYADSRLVAFVPQVDITTPPYSIKANIYGASRLELVAFAEDPTDCYSVWLNPRLHIEKLNTITSALSDIIIAYPEDKICTDKCISTVATDDFIEHLDAMLYSLMQNGKCSEATIAIFAFGNVKAFSKIKNKYNAVIIPCKMATDEWSYKIKTAALSIAQIIEANKYLYIDADTLITDNIAPLFDMIDAIPDDKIFICREASVPSNYTLNDALSSKESIYGYDPEGLELLDLSETEKNYAFVINNGVYAGNQKAIMTLEHAIRSTAPNSIMWEKRMINEKYFWREQAIFNIALAKYNLGFPIDYIYNLQLHTTLVNVDYTLNPPKVFYDNKIVKILHFNGSGRNYCPELKKMYSNLALLNKKVLNPMSAVKRECMVWYNKHNPVQFFDNQKQLLTTMFYIHYSLTKQSPKNVLILDDETCILTAVAARTINPSKVDMISNKVNETLFSNLGIENITTNAQSDPIIYLQKMLETQKIIQKYDTIVVNKMTSQYELYALVTLLKSIITPEGKIIVRYHNNNEFLKAIKKISSIDTTTTDIYLENDLDAKPEFVLIEYNKKIAQSVKKGD